MEIRDIEIFLTLAEELCFGKAAARLHLMQARVSQVIGRQERQLGGLLRRAPYVDPFDRLREGDMDVFIAWLPVDEAAAPAQPHPALTGLPGRAVGRWG